MTKPMGTKLPPSFDKSVERIFYTYDPRTEQLSMQSALMQAHQDSVQPLLDALKECIEHKGGWMALDGAVAALKEWEARNG